MRLGPLIVGFTPDRRYGNTPSPLYQDQILLIQSIVKSMIDSFRAEEVDCKLIHPLPEITKEVIEIENRPMVSGFSRPNWEIFPAAWNENATVNENETVPHVFLRVNDELVNISNKSNTEIADVLRNMINEEIRQWPTPKAYPYKVSYVKHASIRVDKDASAESEVFYFKCNKNGTLKEVPAGEEYSYRMTRTSPRKNGWGEQIISYYLVHKDDVLFTEINDVVKKHNIIPRDTITSNLVKIKDTLNMVKGLELKGNSEEKKIILTAIDLLQKLLMQVKSSNEQAKLDAALPSRAESARSSRIEIYLPQVEHAFLRVVNALKEDRYGQEQVGDIAAALKSLNDIETSSILNG